MSDSTTAPSLRRSRFIWTATFIAIAGHVLLLWHVEWRSRTQINEKTLGIRLEPALPSPAMDDQPEEPETVEVVETGLPEEPVAIGNPEELAAKAPETRTSTTPVNTSVLITRAKAIARKMTAPKNTTRTFSTRDLPIRSKPVTYARAQTLTSTLITQPYRAISQDAQGYTTMLINNGFGRTVCVQERGFKDDPHGPLWYIIPSASCGHLKKK